jgi:hypothetical protein
MLGLKGLRMASLNFLIVVTAGFPARVSQGEVQGERGPPSPCDDGDWGGGLSDCLAEACLYGLDHSVGISIEWLVEVNCFGAWEVADDPVSCGFV